MTGTATTTMRVAVRELEMAAVSCAEMNTKRLQTEIVQLHARLAALLQEYEELHSPMQMAMTTAETWIAEYLETLRAFDACVQQCSTKGSIKWLLTKRDHKQVIRDLHVRLDAAQLALTEGSRTKTLHMTEETQRVVAQPSSSTAKSPIVRPLDSEDVRFLLARIADAEAMDDEKPAALRQLRHLTARETYKKQIVEAGGVRLVVARLRHGSDVEKIDAVAILRSLALANTKVKSEITSSGGIQAFVGLARDGIDGLKAQAASALWSLAFDATSRDAIVEAGGLEALAELVRGGTNDEAENALRALRELIHTENTQTKFLKTGGFRLLADRVREGTQVQKELAMGMLATLVADVDPDAMAEDVSSNLMKVMLDVIRTSTNKQREPAIGVVHSLITKLRAAREEFYRGGGRALFTRISNEGSDQEKSVAQLVLDELAYSELYENGQDFVLTSPPVEQGPETNRHLTQPRVRNSADITTLIEQLRTGTHDVKVIALGNLCECVRQSMANMIAVVNSGAISDLISLVRLGTLEQKTRAVRVLMGIAETTSLRSTIVAASGIPVLVNCINVQMVDGLSNHQDNELSMPLDTSFASLVEQSLEVLAHVIHGDVALKRAITRSGVVNPAMVFLYKGTASQTSSARALFLGLANDSRSAGPVLYFLAAALCEGSQLEQKAAGHALRVILSQSKVDSSASITPAGALIRCLQNGDQQLKTDALVVMDKMMRWCNSRDALYAQGAVPPLIDILCCATEEHKLFAISILARMKFSAENLASIIEGGGIDPLVRLARDGTFEQQKNAGLLLSTLTQVGSAREHMVKSGAVQVLANLLQHSEWSLVCSILGALCVLAREADARRVLKENGVVSMVFKLMRSASQNARLHCQGVHLLAALAYDTDARAQIAQARGYELLVQLFQVANENVKDAAIKALYVALFHGDIGSVEAAVKAGVVKVLVMVTGCSWTSRRAQAAGALAGVASFEKYRRTVVNAGGIPVLANVIRLGTDREKVAALEALIQLSRSDAICPIIADAGGVEAAVLCLTSDDQNVLRFRICIYVEEIMLRAVRMLSTVAYGNPTIRARVAKAGGIAALVSLVRDGTDVQKEMAVTALHNCVDGNELVVINTGGVSAVIQLLKSGRTAAGKNGAASCVLHMSANEPCRQAIVDAGGVQVLVDLLSSGTAVQKTRSLQALRNLALIVGVREMIGETQAIRSAVQFAASREHAKDSAELLCNLAFESPANKARIAGAGGLEELVDLARAGTDAERISAARALSSIVGECKTAVMEAGGDANLGARSWWEREIRMLHSAECSTRLTGLLGTASEDIEPVVCEYCLNSRKIETLHRPLSLG